MNAARKPVLLAAAVTSELTYDHVGSTLTGSRGRRRETTIPSLDHGRDALRAWAAHRAFGAEVYPPAPPIEEGVTLLVLLRVGPLTFVAPNRIVAVVDEPGRFGFAYGTLPGHPERGEESFVVEARPDGSALASVTVDAVPATLLTKVGSPVVRLLQSRAVQAYLDGIRQG